MYFAKGLLPLLLMITVQDCRGTWICKNRNEKQCKHDISNGYCHDDKNGPKMVKMCPLICGLCGSDYPGCVDKSYMCPSWAKVNGLCKTKMVECPYSCAKCQPPSTGGQPSPAAVTQPTSATLPPTAVTQPIPTTVPPTGVPSPQPSGSSVPNENPNSPQSPAQGKWRKSGRKARKHLKKKHVH